MTSSQIMFTNSRIIVMINRMVRIGHPKMTINTFFICIIPRHLICLRHAGAFYFTCELTTTKFN